LSSDEPRALTSALASPAFVTRGGGAAVHAANRHVERWAPEQGASHLRPLRNLGFVDRLVSPWIESAQRSTSLRMFSQVMSSGTPERAAPSNTSWVFPRPWYQDELDWMAAARQVGTQSAVQQASAPNLLTTRGTYVAPAQARSQIALPTTLHEYIAPSLSMARPDISVTNEAYSPLVPFAAAQAAHVMARAVAPLGGQGKAARMSPGLREVLTSMLERATHSDVAPTRTSMTAPELVTPPAPRRDEPATQIADRYAEQHAQLADLQRLARDAAERRAASTASAATDAQQAEIRAAQARAVAQREAEIQRRLAESGRRDDAVAQARAAAARQQETLRLHEQSREAAARDARSAAFDASAPSETRTQDIASARDNRVAVEIAAAVAALPPELAAMVTAGISQRPERAMQAIGELSDALRSVELIARNSAAGGTFEPTRGPRVVMPAGLGGLVSTVEHTTASDRVITRMPTAPVQPKAMTRMPALALLSPPPAPTNALAAATSAIPAALSHVAWSDRWLARFAGANPQSLDMLAAAAASPESRMQLLAAGAPHTVFVAPMFEERSQDAGNEARFSGARTQDALPTLRGGPPPTQPVVRFDDDAETPDDMFAAIAMSASRARAGTTVAAPPKLTLPTIDPDRYQPRDTLADLVAHAAPNAPSAGLSAQLASSPFAAALRHVMPLGVAPSFDVRSLFGAGLSATYLAGLLSPSTNEISLADSLRPAFDFEPTYVAPEAGDHEPIAEHGYDALTTLRSALLSRDTSPGAAVDARSTGSAPLARTMIDSLALPMLGDSAAAYDAFGDATHATTYAAPGMIAERAQAWSIAQQRSSSDLAFDFVTPELVLAARIYGLGPAEAAQAARLAVAGPGQLSAMAGTVDRTFVQAMAIEAERRGERTRTAYPIAVEAGSARPVAYSPSGETAATTFAPSGSTFGVGRRMPRGAFLWPAATTAALGMNAAAPDGDHSMSVAALELLAAQAVAELGTFTALSDVERISGDATSSARGADAGAAEPRDEDVLSSALTLVPTARREKFQALYVALSQSPSGRTWSPAARAARALALAGRGEDTVSARERATVAWDVLPVVYGVDAEIESLSTGEAAARTARRREELRAFEPMLVEGRPGLANLSSRAGEALSSYVAPSSSAGGASSSSSRESGALLRAPTAAPELVQTGRPAGRYGGGELEIPAWFEDAARKMFAKASTASDGISLAELTLVAAAPPQQIAASSRTASAPAPAAPAPAAAASPQKQQVDIEKLANDVYREVLVLMDIARARNGEPYL
jgi:trimeric autotransporter adhesin